MRRLSVRKFPWNIGREEDDAKKAAAAHNGCVTTIALARVKEEARVDFCARINYIHLCGSRMYVYIY